MNPTPVGQAPPCPGCGHVFEKAYFLNGKRLEPGDWFLCGHCGFMLVVTEDGVRPPTVEEMKQRAAEDPEAWASLERSIQRARLHTAGLPMPEAEEYTAAIPNSATAVIVEAAKVEVWEDDLGLWHWRLASGAEGVAATADLAFEDALDEFIKEQSDDERKPRN